MGYLYYIFSSYYIVVLILQAVCVLHSIRRGNQQKWIWIIVFLPLIGSLAYIFTEIVKRRHVSDLQSKVTTLVNPKGRISDLEKQFKFSPTFTNRVALADAYLENGMTERAIELYEQSLEGVFKDNEHVIKQLIHAYYSVNRFEDIVKIAPKVRNGMNFSKTQTNLLYAFALEKTGDLAQLEKEFKAMNHRYTNYEARYRYGDFLLRQNRKEEAALIFYDIMEEGQNMSRREKGDGAIWINKAGEEWRKIMQQ